MDIMDEKAKDCLMGYCRSMGVIPLVEKGPLDTRGWPATLKLVRGDGVGIEFLVDEIWDLPRMQEVLNEVHPTLMLAIGPVDGHA